jgi:hypothetical protein
MAVITGALFPKFVILFGSPLHELRKAKGTGSYDFWCRFRFEAPGANSRQTVQELQIGGTSELEPAAMRALARSHHSPRSKTKRPPFQAAREGILGVRQCLSMLRSSGFGA